MALSNASNRSRTTVLAAVRFDYYAATSREADSGELLRVFDCLPTGVTFSPAHGLYRFRNRVVVTDASGNEQGQVLWNGSEPGVSMIEAWGENAPAVVEKLRESFRHRVTRVDACADFDAPQAFARLLRIVRRVKKKWHLVGERRGDWDLPAHGRTQYIGSPLSTTRLRLYEKGKHPEFEHLGRSDWARLELQVRPKGAAKERYAALSALDCWGATKWSREICELALAAHVHPHPAGTIYRRPDEERKLFWMCKQYRATLMSLYQDCGSWELVGRNLGEVLQKT